MNPAKNRTEPKQFALLLGDTYYPNPGWYGFDSWHETLEGAKSEATRQCGDCDESLSWWQVLDVTTFKIVAGAGKGHTGLFGKVDCTAPKQ